MESAPEADDLVVFGFGLGKADGSFDSFCAAAVEVSASQLRGRGLAKQTENFGPLGGGESSYDQAGGLFGQRLRQSGVAVAEGGDRDAGEKVEVGVAVGIGERGAVAMIEGDLGEQRDALAAWRHMALFLVKDCARFGSRDRGFDLGQFGAPVEIVHLSRRPASEGPRTTRRPRGNLLVLQFGSGQKLRLACAPLRWSRRHRRAIARDASTRTRLKLGQSLKSIILNPSSCTTASPPQVSSPSASAAVAAARARSSLSR